MQQFPLPLYKIKLDKDEDVEILRELKNYSDVIFPVDVNCVWTAEETFRNSKLLKELNDEFLEQPLPRDDKKRMAKLFKILFFL